MSSFKKTQLRLKTLEINAALILIRYGIHEALLIASPTNLM